MKKRENLLLKWRNNILLAAKALEEKNYQLYENLMDNINGIFNDIKNIDDLTYECRTFGQSNYIFEDALPLLFKTNKQAVKEIITLIQEDNNLLSQFRFLSALKKYKPSIDADNYIQESLKLAKENINSKTINESNKKLSELIHKYEILPSKKINEDTNHFFESCDYVLKHPTKLNNLSQIKENIKYINEYITKNSINEINQKSNNIIQSIDEFDSKYNNLLNISEKKFLKDLLSTDENKSKTIYNNLKNECLQLTQELITSSDDSNEKNKLSYIQETINHMTYDSNKLLEDVTKFLNIQEVLRS